VIDYFGLEGALANSGSSILQNQESRIRYRDIRPWSLYIYRSIISFGKKDCVIYLDACEGTRQPDVISEEESRWV
jgi:hypothetical protein